MENMEKLKQEGIYTEGDAFLYGVSTPELWQFAVYGGPLAAIIGTTNFAITRDEKNITIVPCNKVTNAVIIEQKIIIPNKEITHFNVDHGDMGFYKISIMKDEACLFSFQVTKNVTQMLRENLDLLLLNFNCINKEIIKEPNKFFVGFGVFLLILVMIIAFIFSIIQGQYIVMLGCLYFFWWLISTYMKAKKKK